MILTPRYLSQRQREGYQIRPILIPHDENQYGESFDAVAIDMR